tara:strand:+ start:212 stop:1510 length:1299 start_codon:yes stop_codon:yes gene_type:complete
MNTFKTKLHGKPVFCTQVITGETYSDGRKKKKSFYAPRRADSVAKATEFFQGNNLIVEKYKAQTLPVKKKVPLFIMYDQLIDTWDNRVIIKRKNPKNNKGITEDTKDRYLEYAKAFFKIVDPQTNIHSIDKKWVDQFIKKLNKTQTESAAYRIYSFFNMLMLQAEKVDVIEYSPTHSFREDRPTYSCAGKEAINPIEMRQIYLELKYGYIISQKDRQEKRVWQSEDNKKLKAELQKNNIQLLKVNQNIWREPENQTALVLMFQAVTGARWGEIAALTRADIDFNKNTITISKSRSAKSGKVSLTKSGHLRAKGKDMGTRIVPFPEEFAEFIKFYLDKNGVNEDGFLFDCTYSTTQKTFLRACKRAGSTQKETKIFRRFVSTQLRKGGATRDEVRYRLGHSNDGTQDIYTTYEDPNAQNHSTALHRLLNKVGG